MWLSDDSNLDVVDAVVVFRLPLPTIAVALVFCLP